MERKKQLFEACCKRICLLLICVICCVTLLPMKGKAQAQVYAKGEDLGCSWVLDKQGKLTIRSVDPDSNLRNDAWKKYKDRIITVDIDVPFSSCLEDMFRNFDKLESAKIKIDETAGSAKGMLACGTSVRGTFYSNLTSLDLKGFNTAGITDMTEMFYECKSLETLDLSNFDLSNAEYMESMFYGCLRLTGVKWGKTNAKKLYSTSKMFSYCQSLKSMDLSGFKTENLVATRLMFEDCNELKNVNLDGWDVRKLWDAGYMFYGCFDLEKVSLNGWKTNQLEKMSGMFNECRSLKTIDLSFLKTNRCKEMNNVFAGCKSLTSVNLSGWNTESLVVASSMFGGCESLKNLDLSSFSFAKYNLSSINGNVAVLFSGCDQLEVIKTPKNVKVNFNLPENESGWYRNDTHENQQYLPKNLKYSVAIHRQEKDNKFVDVRVGGWEHENINAVYKAKLMNGKGTTKDKANLVVFDPSANITRAEFVQTLYNYSANPAVKYKNVFKDVPKDQWYTNAILWAYNNKLVSGVGNNKFGVNQKITRQDMVSMLYRYAQKFHKSSTTNATKFKLTAFTDHNQVAEYARVPMQWATGNKIMNGKPLGGGKYKLCPKDNATRAECAVILNNYMKLVAKK